MPALLFKLFVPFVLIAALWSAAPATAQDRVWVQIEALASRAEAEARAAAYTAVFPETVGFRLPSGWYAVALGPYAVGEGAAQLAGLRRENLIPRDSFIAYGDDYREQFWPPGAADGLTTEPAATPVAPDAPITAAPLPADGATAIAEPAPAPAPAPEPIPEPEETPAQARASEQALTRPDRELLQTALQWYGHYSARIDGAFGPGTRNSMASWQAAMGLEQTGILTSRQRATLVTNYQTDLAAYGFAPVTETEAGIDITLPLALVEFDHYEPPFVHFRAKAGSDLRILLISQPGDQASLYGLYDILQTLEIMPLTGERSRNERSFSLRGTSATLDSVAYAELKGGLIKGWMMISTPGNAARDARIAAVLQASFAPSGDRALDPGMVPMDAAAKRGLLSGLEVRRPRLSRSGFYVTAAGAVLTTDQAVASCGRITLDRAYEADVTLTDAALGIAVLTPRTALAPPAVAAFQTAAPRVGAEIAAAGYSYEDKLPAPVLTFGTLDEASGLNGEPGLARLTLAALPGDAGGPVVDGTGAVIGMLLPQAAQGGKQLPADTAFVATAAGLAARLTGAGLILPPVTGGGALAPEDLSQRATGMTVLVSCWE